MKQDFLNYIQETFAFESQEMQDFEQALSRPLKKTIRVNTKKITLQDFQKRAQDNNWELTQTPLGKNMFYIDRTSDLDIALWNTIEHLNGYFYVQELAASSSPYYMSKDKIDTWNYTILDMSASPGGKTTQLSEYYPNSLIVANELDKSRLKWLFSNIDRMGGENICVTNYDGRFFKQIPETFDKVLLDAPCSGEGTAFKTDDALKHWNIKNIKRISKLQFGLLEAAGKTVKVWGEIVYSTCTLNRLENEEVLEKFLKKYEWCFEIIPLQQDVIAMNESEEAILQSKKTASHCSQWHNSLYIRNWPHKNNTGWFFVAKIRKIQSLEGGKDIKSIRQNYEKLSSKETKVVQDFYHNTFGIDASDMYFYTYRGEVYITSKSIHHLWESLFVYQIGKKIGTLENSIFIPNFYGTLSLPSQKSVLQISKQDVHTLYTWNELETLQDEWYYEITSHGISAGVVKIKGWKMKSLLDTGKMRK